MNSDGQKLCPDSDLQKLQKKLKTKQMAEIFRYFQYVGQFLDHLHPEHYRRIPTIFYEEFNATKTTIASFQARVRTIRALYKKPAFLQKVMGEINRLNTVNESYLSQLTQLWTTGGILSENSSDEKWVFPTIPESENTPLLWDHIETTKETLYTLSIGTAGVLKNFEEWLSIRDAAAKLEKFNKMPQFLLQELSAHSEISGHSTLQDLEFRRELFFYMDENGVLKSGKVRSQKDKDTKKQATAELVSYLDTLLHQVMHNLSQNCNQPYSEDSTAFRDIPRFFTEILQLDQDNLTVKHKGDLIAANKEFQSRGTQYFEILDGLEEWLGSMLPIYAPYGKIVKKYQNMMTRERGDVGRLLDDFEQYAVSVKEESERTDFNIILDTHVQELEDIITKYHTEADGFMQQTLPDLSPLHALIQKYHSLFDTVRKKINGAFKDYKKNDVEVSANLELWEEKYQAILNRVNFSVKQALKAIVGQFQDIVTEEELFGEALENFTDTSMGSELSTVITTDILIPERLTAKQIRGRLEVISGKITRMEAFQRAYVVQKAHLQRMLEENLKANHNIESKKCIICHKSVDVSKDHFINCEFCGSLSHYICGAWWINKYNSCPVCHNQYTIPDSPLFDPEAVYSEENELI